MPELPISSAVRLAWHLAGGFALRCGEDVIQPKDLLCGICSLEKAASAGRLPAQTPAAAERLRTETQQLTNLAQRHSIDLSAVRHAIRDASPVWKPSPPEEHVVSRGPEVRTIFDRAEEIARGNGLAEMDLLSLLRALLESSDEVVAALMESSAQGMLHDLCRSS